MKTSFIKAIMQINSIRAIMQIGFIKAFRIDSIIIKINFSIIEVVRIVVIIT